MDIRHPLQEYDWQMIQWAHQCNLPMHLLLTKADKLKNGPAKATQLSVAQQVRQKGIANISVQTFSSLKKTGLDELKKFLNQHLAVTGQ